MRLYLNGILMHLKRMDSAIGLNREPVLIGGYLTGWSLDGYMDDVMIYGRALTEDEVEHVYEMQRTQTASSAARATGECVAARVSTALCADGSSVQDMVYHAASDGYVRLPEGCYEVTGTIDIQEGISVLGSGLGQTVLCRSISGSGNASAPLFRVVGADQGISTRISGVAFVGVRSEDDAGWDRGVLVQDCTDFRVDSCYFEGFGEAAVKVTGDSRGVIDHCVFVDNYKPAIGNVGYGVSVYGTETEDDGLQLGTAEATFVEDCIIVGSRHAVASNAGAHYVFRHNLVEGNVVSTAIDAHGPGHGSQRGTFCIEVYGNTVRSPASGDDLGMLIRGGSGVIFSNTIDGYRMPIGLVLEYGMPDELRGEYPWLDQVQDLWVWDNFNGDELTLPYVQSHDRSVDYIRVGRDYFLEERPGYIPFDYPHPLTRDGQ
jgi:hypothetical protein